MYGKHFASTYTGSMFGAGPELFAVWGYVIANTVESQIELNPIAIAPALGMTPEAVARCINKLCEPDPNSRSKVADGCRLIREGQFAYHVPNHNSYRLVRDEQDRREYNRLKKAEGRSRGVNTRVKKSIRVSSVSANTEADTEADTEAKVKDILVAATVTDNVFDEAWALYPRRGGSNPKRDALHAWRARIGERVVAGEMLAGVRRYRAFCERTGKVGSEYVMQARRFFGPARPFAESWETPTDPDAWKRDPTQFRPGESDEAYILRTSRGNGR